MWLTGVEIAYLRACAVENLAFLIAIIGITPIPMASQSTLSSSSLAELNPPMQPPSFPPSDPDTSQEVATVRQAVKTFLLQVSTAILYRVSLKQFQ